MITDVDWTTQEVTITSEKNKVTYTLKKHTRFPSLFVFHQSKGVLNKELDKMFTSMEEGLNHIKTFLDQQKYSTAAYGDKRQKERDAAKSKSTSKIQQGSDN